jgi:hypothetical protein
MDILEYLQHINSQTRAVHDHVVYEDKLWMHAFNLAIGVDSLFEFMLNWFSDHSSAHSVYKNSNATTKVHFYHLETFSVLQMLEKIYTKIVYWQQNNNPENSAGLLFSYHRHTYSAHFQDSHLFDLVINPYFHEISLNNLTRSFHYPLHRFLSYVIVEATKFPHLLDTLVQFHQKLQNISSSTIPASYSEFTIARIALISLAFAKEIEAGLWRKNGMVVLHQQLNYSQAPFCRMNYDLDLMLLQFSLVNIPVPLFLALILSSFNLHLKLFPLANLSGYDTELIAGLSKNPLESHFVPQVTAEMLDLMVNIVTELPPLPSDNVAERLSVKIRREFVNRLAGGVATYSQLQESLGSLPDASKIPSEVLDKILADISIKQVINPLSPPTYTLKRELWKEYDPSFPHIGKSLHQVASDRKPKPLKEEPMIYLPFPVHPLYHRMRSSLLFHQDFLIFLRQIFFSVAKTKLSPSIPSYKSGYFEVLPVLNDACYSRAMQLITIIIHLLKDEEISFEEDAAFKDHRKKSFFQFLLNDAIILPDVLYPSRQLKFPCLFKIWFELYKYFMTTFDTRAEQHHLGWILQQCKEINEDCKRMYSSLENENSVLNTESNEKQKKMEDSKSRSLNAVSEAAKNFLAMLEDISDSDEDDEDEDDKPAAKMSEPQENCEKMEISDTTNEPQVNGNEEKGKTEGEEGKKEDEEHVMETLCDDTCIICQTDRTGEADENGSQNDVFSKLGYLALIQPSKVLWSRVHFNEFHSLEIVTSPERNSWAYLDLHSCNTCIGMCGHVMHLDCFEMYFNSMKQRSAQHNHMLYDGENGYFPCPLCKKLCNGVVKYPEKSLTDPVVPATKQSEKMDEEEENDAVLLVPTQKKSGKGTVEWMDRMYNYYNRSTDGQIYMADKVSTLLRFPAFFDIEHKVNWERQENILHSSFLCNFPHIDLLLLIGLS